MQLANVNIPDTEYTLDPFFEPFVQKLALDMPNFLFTSKGIDNMSYASSYHDIEHRQVAPEEKRWLIKLNVYDKLSNEHLGSIGVYRQYRGRSQCCVYKITSWRINNQRGDRNTTYTSKLPVAVRAAKRALIPKGYDEVYTHEKERLVDAFNGALRDLSMPIRNGQLLPSSGTTLLQIYAYHKVKQTPPESLKDSGMWPNHKMVLLEQALATEKYDTAMSEFFLSNHMRTYHEHGHVIAVIAYNNGFMYKPKGEEAIAFHSFDELPEVMQNHIGVLQLVKDSELVKDVGFRHSERS